MRDWANDWLGGQMIALLIVPLLVAFAFSSAFEAEAERIAEENGIEDFDPDEPSIYDDRNVEFGTNRADNLTGTSGDDAIFALGQADVVRALAGDDLVEAGSNNDTVFGAEGDDILGGGSGADVLYGDQGNDALLGNGGDDLLIGRGGDDLLIGGGGADSLNGGPGADLLISGNVEIDGEGEVDLNAAALAAARAYSSADIEDIDFATLEAEGALNGVDDRFLAQRPEATQGGDLRGGADDDILILAGGDTAEGGTGSDTFVLHEDMQDEMTVVITDFAADDDLLILEHDTETAPEIELRDRGEDAVLFIGEAVIARIEGAAGLQPSAIRLVQAD